MLINILTIGDIVGAPGRAVLRKHLREFREERSIDFVVANAENVTGGSGIAIRHAEEVWAAGVDVITGGDHLWRRREVIKLLESDPRVVRAANFSRHVPGKGYTVATSARGIEVGVLHLIGRVFMQPIDCPFEAATNAVTALRAKTRIIVVDMHCEATSEKLAMGRHLDGQVSIVFGTHTHVPTADVRILPGGTGYITDVGMTGPYDSILGRRTDRVLKRFVTGMPAAFDVARDDPRICAALFTVDTATGECREAERVEISD